MLIMHNRILEISWCHKFCKNESDYLPPQNDDYIIYKMVETTSYTMCRLKISLIKSYKYSYAPG